MFKSKNELTIGKKLWILSSALVVNLFILGAISYHNAKSIAFSIDEADLINMPSITYMGRIDMFHDGIRANVLQALLISGSTDEKKIQSVTEERAEFHKEIKEAMTKMAALDLAPNVRDDLKESIPLLDAYIAASTDIVDSALAGRKEEALAKLPEFTKKFEELEKALGDAGEYIEKEVASDADKHHTSTSEAILFLLITILVSASIGLVSSWMVIKNLKKSLQDITVDLSRESQSVASAASQLTKSSENLSSATSDQASALQETAASVDEITAMVKKTSENAKHLEETANASEKSAKEGQASIREMLSSIEAISASYGKIMTNVEEGNHKITDIVKVIGEIGTKTKVINDIVFQTKLLSFNASVEAARAGEHGKGFAVVAEEVGNLAQMSGNAAKEISDMLEASMAKVEGIVSENKRSVESLIVDGKSKIENGNNVAKQCGLSLENIVGGSTDVGARISEITTAIDEQNRGIQEISKAIQLLDQSTHKNSSTSKETANTSQSLLQQAHSLSDIVSHIDMMINGASQMGNRARSRNIASSVKSIESEQSNTKILPFEKRTSQAKEVKRAKNYDVKEAVGGSANLPSENDPRFEDI